MSNKKWTAEKEQYLTDNIHKTVKALAVELQVSEGTVRKNFHRIKKKIKSSRVTPPSEYSNKGYLSLINSV